MNLQASAPTALRRQVPIFRRPSRTTLGRMATSISSLGLARGGRHAGHRKPEWNDRCSWVDYARLIEQAGATALELNIYRIAPGASVTGAEAEANCVRFSKPFAAK